jgi:hypothetical protein
MVLRVDIINCCCVAAVDGTTWGLKFMSSSRKAAKLALHSDHELRKCFTNYNFYQTRLVSGG